ncbi:MAG: hypothetical protein IPP81_14605 [Chitinophagaceae bacterium]|nr:hypothetical protein [Chitinophagaceae bacterium]
MEKERLYYYYDKNDRAVNVNLYPNTNLVRQADGSYKNHEGELLSRKEYVRLNNNSTLLCEVVKSENSMNPLLLSIFFEMPPDDNESIERTAVAASKYHMLENLNSEAVRLYGICKNKDSSAKDIKSAKAKISIIKKELKDIGYNEEDDEILFNRPRQLSKKYTDYTEDDFQVILNRELETYAGEGSAGTLAENLNLFGPLIIGTLENNIYFYEKAMTKVSNYDRSLIGLSIRFKAWLKNKGKLIEPNLGGDNGVTSSRVALLYRYKARTNEQDTVIITNMNMQEIAVEWNIRDKKTGIVNKNAGVYLKKMYDSFTKEDNRYKKLLNPEVKQKKETIPNRIEDIKWVISNLGTHATAIKLAKKELNILEEFLSKNISSQMK